MQKLDYFKIIKEDPVLKAQSLMVGASIGVCAMWEAPLACIMIGIELSERYFSVNSIFLTFLSAYMTCFTVKNFNNYFGLFHYGVETQEISG